MSAATPFLVLALLSDNLLFVIQSSLSHSKASTSIFTYVNPSLKVVIEKFFVEEPQALTSIENMHIAVYAGTLVFLLYMKIII